MTIRELEISHFRNLGAVSLSLNSQFNYLFGTNGAGKTSVLEAVHVLARGRSFRSRRIAPIIQIGERNLLLRADLDGGQSMGLVRERSGTTRLHVDRTEVRRLSDAAALLPIHLILPEVSHLLFGGPKERRQCLDWGMFHVKPGFLPVLRNYLSAMRQRNAALRSGAGGGSRAEIHVWTDTLCEAAKPVHDMRRTYVAELIPHFHAALAGLGMELPVELVYKNGWGEPDFAKVLGESLDNDVKYGTTGSGPHRADLSFKVAEQDAAAILSRGQGKLLAIALILGQAQLFQLGTGRRSVFLIDDLGAELDCAHSSRMLTLLQASKCQVIATSTRSPSDEFGALYGPDHVAMFHVKQGRIEPVC